jgi:hypothetical protein
MSLLIAMLGLPKGLASHYWEEIILALIGGNFQESQTVRSVEWYFLLGTPKIL